MLCGSDLNVKIQIVQIWISEFRNMNLKSEFYKTDHWCLLSRTLSFFKISRFHLTTAFTAVEMESGHTGGKETSQLLVFSLKSSHVMASRENRKEHGRKLTINCNFHGQREAQNIYVIIIGLISLKLPYLSKGVWTVINDKNSIKRKRNQKNVCLKWKSIL